jgi:uncharacterized protein
VRDAGRLLDMSAGVLAELAHSPSATEAAIGFAAINALLPRPEQDLVAVNAEEVIAQQGEGKQVAVIGHFPFVDNLRARVGDLFVLEQSPRGNDLPSTAAHQVIPRVDVVAITGSALVNHTLESLMGLVHCGTTVLVLGPSTPLSPVLFRYGMQYISGTVVEDIDATLRTVRQGANFQQLHR